MMAEGEGVELGRALFRPALNDLIDAEGAAIALRPQSREVLRMLYQHAGRTVGRAEIIDAVWPDLSVTDDSLTQCIADIRRAIDDTSRKIVQTVPKRGYRLAVLPAPITPPTMPASRGSGQPAIAVLPFEDFTGQDRWRRFGRGLAIGVSDELAHNREIAVIGSETTFAASKRDLSDAGKELNANFVLGGSIQADDRNLRITARLHDADQGKLLWSESWCRPLDDYAAIHDDIVARIHSSLIVHFWFGVINRAVAAKAKTKPPQSLSAYEKYLLGIEKILWQKADYLSALQHFHDAVEIEPHYARAWAMIGVLKHWIGDVSKGPAQDRLYAESAEAVRRAALLEPHDAFVVFMTSTVHLRAGRVEAARRAVRTAVGLSPNNPDILAMAAWESMMVGITGEDPLNWARRAIDLNPKGPPWHKLGLGSAAFAAGAYEECIAAMEDAPPHHKKHVYLAAANMILGHEAKARLAAETLLRNHPDYTLAGKMNLPMNPEIERLLDNAVKAGIPPG